MSSTAGRWPLIACMGLQLKVLRGRLFGQMSFCTEVWFALPTDASEVLLAGGTQPRLAAEGAIFTATKAGFDAACRSAVLLAHVIAGGGPSQTYLRTDRWIGDWCLA